MNTKICLNCNVEKSFDYFGTRNSNLDKKRTECKECEKIKRTAYKRTRHGLCLNIYHTQQESSKRRGHIQPEYTPLELEEWIMSHDIFEPLYLNWCDNDYDMKLRPSVDRKEDSIHYIMDNLELMTWGENEKKARGDMKTGKLITRHRTVAKYSLDGVFIEEYMSLTEADRMNPACDFRNIQGCCNHNYGRKSCGGFKWEYAK